jgi:hypothetical protein
MVSDDGEIVAGHGRLLAARHLGLGDAVNQFEFWDAKIGAIDDWPDVDGTLGASVDASVWGRLTDDDPAASPDWGALMRIDSAEIDARAIGQIECRMRSDDRLFNLWIAQLRVLADEVT